MLPKTQQKNPQTGPYCNTLEKRLGHGSRASTEGYDIIIVVSFGDEFTLEPAASVINHK